MEYHSEYSASRTIVSEFARQAKLLSGKLAIKADGASISYRELDETSARLALALTSYGISEGDRVGLCLNRSIDAVVAMLAVLKLNCTYVLLSVDFSFEKIQSISETFSVTKVIFDIGSDPRLEQWDLAVSLLNLKDTSAKEEGQLNVAPKAAHPMYFILTSGTTGDPKGVAVSQASVINLVKDNSYIAISEEDIFLHLSSLIFDGSIFEIWGALLNGATLVVMPPGYPELSVIADKIQREAVTILFITTKLFNAMVNNRLADLASVTKVLFGGEVASQTCVKKFLAQMASESYLANIYGPTECTTFSAFFPIRKDYDFKSYPSIPIGKAIKGVELVVVDENMNMLSNGVGELLIGGKGLGRYIEDEHASSKKFIKNPFNELDSDLLFFTSDLVELKKDGNFLFIGRSDRLVKIRGFRVNLEEIEKAAGEFPGVKIAAVIHDKSGDIDILTLFIDGEAETEGLKTYLKEMLPHYMQPNKVVFTSIPLSRSGKVNFQFLTSNSFQKEREVMHEFPDKNQLKKIIRVAWQEELPGIVFSDEDDFLDVGGNSLMLINILDRLQKNEQAGSFLKKITVIDLFDHASINCLADYLSARHGTGS